MPFDVNALELEKSFETSFDLPDFYSDIYSMTSYDDSGEFNGYIVTGYDSDNKKGYITKFTYPKKVIESKNSDVEVIY